MTLPARRLRGLVYRAHHPRWAFAPGSGAGAGRHGGRFNRPGSPALYTSLAQTTAWIEAQQGFLLKPRPLTLVAYEVDCADLVDLTDPAVRRRLGMSVADLACAWEDLADRGETPPSWRLAERLVAEGAAGLLAPSFAPGAGTDDVNAVFWDWADEPPHQVRPIDPDGRLPRDDRSWRAATGGTVQADRLRAAIAEGDAALAAGDFVEVRSGAELARLFDEL